MLPEGIDRATADVYFGNRYGAGEWDGANGGDKDKVLCTAAEILSQYQGVTAAGDYEKALYEQALWILDSAVGELQEQGIASHSISGISQSFDLKGRPAHVAPRAWQFLKRGRSAGPVWLT